MEIYRGNIYFEDDNFEKKFDATLSIENDQYIIEIQSAKFQSKNHKIIQGEFIDLGFVTFIECYHSGSTSSIVNLQKFNVSHIITSIKFNSYVNLIGTSFHVKMDSLKNWLRKSNLKGSIIFDEKIEYIKPKNILLYENDYYSININWCLNESRKSNDTIIINEYCELEIKTKNNAINIFEFYNIYKKIKTFLAFVGVFSEKNDVFHLREERLIYEQQDEPIVMKFFTKNFETKNNGLLTHERINYENISTDINEILNNWFTNIKIQDSIILVMEKYTFIKLTVETYFLNVCFAIETFHRKNKINKILSDAEFKKIKNGIRSKLETEDEIKLFNDKLIYANEPTFKERLLSLELEFNFIISSDINIKDYITKIVRQRNYLVHRDSKKEIFSSLELYYASVYIETLTKFCIMTEIGFSEEYLKIIFSNTGNKINQAYEFNVNKF